MPLAGRFFRSSFHGKLDRRMRWVDNWLEDQNIPVRISTPGWWWFIMNEPPTRWAGTFKKDHNPRRWGFYLLGLEIGSRG